MPTFAVSSNKVQLLPSQAGVGSARRRPIGRAAAVQPDARLVHGGHAQRTAVLVHRVRRTREGREAPAGLVHVAARRQEASGLYRPAAAAAAAMAAVEPSSARHDDGQRLHRRRLRSRRRQLSRRGRDDGDIATTNRFERCNYARHRPIFFSPPPVRSAQLERTLGLFVETCGRIGNYSLFRGTYVLNVRCTKK